MKFSPTFIVAMALEACPPGSKNCIRTSWIPPAGTSKAAMAEAVKDALNKYPQAGQNGVDKGGFKIVEEKLAKSGTARIEFMNNGPASKLFNGGQPFVDDLKIEIEKDTVQVRSSSRMGKSDLGVNQKRLTYIGNTLKSKGWNVPPPKY